VGLVAGVIFVMVCTLTQNIWKMDDE
jgi:ammonia channel protein AmtB